MFGNLYVLFTQEKIKATYVYCVYFRTISNLDAYALFEKPKLMHLKFIYTIKCLNTGFAASNRASAETKT